MKKTFSIMNIAGIGITSDPEVVTIYLSNGRSMEVQLPEFCNVSVNIDNGQAYDFIIDWTI